jgi:hypothetical protein
MFERIYREGNWDGAVRHRQQQQQSWKIIDGEAAAKSVKPWAVLVTVRFERMIVIFGIFQIFLTVACLG